MPEVFFDGLTEPAEKRARLESLVDKTISGPAFSAGTKVRAVLGSRSGHDFD